MKQRTFFEELWKDPIFVNLSKASKLLAIYCMTNSNIKLIRACRLTDREIIFDTGLTPKDLKIGKKDLINLGIIFIDDFLVIKSQYSVFKFKGPQIEIAKRKQICDIPDNVLEVMKSNTPSIGYLWPIDGTNDSEDDSEDDNRDILKKEKNIEDKKILETYNNTWGCNTKSSRAWKSNYETWRKDFSFEEIQQSVAQMRWHKWILGLKGRFELEHFFRTDKSWIQQCLDAKDPDNEQANWVEIKK